MNACIYKNSNVKPIGFRGMDTLGGARDPSPRRLYIYTGGGCELNGHNQRAQ